MKKYNHKAIENRWRKKWESEKAFKIDKSDTSKKKFYLLDMFPYPSGDGLHMGHTKSYTSTDIVYRHKKMCGYSVLHPQGFDAFGLPAENYAIKTGTHPKETTKKNTANYIKQMKSLGFGYDFDEKINTSEQDYYKWTQWLFTEFFTKGLVYKKTDRVNWCSLCKTVLANEQVVNNGCERCGDEIEQKEAPAWFFKISDLADELIDGLKNLDWPEHTKKNQINWIGRSKGSELFFKIKTVDKTTDKSLKFSVFTTRPDTLFGCTYCVFSPEHKMVSSLKNQIENIAEVEKYIKQSSKKTERERIENKEKTGIRLEGITAINPVNDEEVPVFIADYILTHYGSGAIMAVPAHDARDYEFAKKFNLPIKEVIEQSKHQKTENKEDNNEKDDNIKTNTKDESINIFDGKGILINSGKFNGMNSEEAGNAITKLVVGEAKTTYRLRDWSISRQRYWGVPIPIVYDTENNPHKVPKEHLPWVLPEDVDFVPTGEAPLKNSKELHSRTEKIFGKGWTPETDTMDTFVCSSWYFLRYPDPHNTEEFCSKKHLEHWLPVDLYIGGAEHTYMHLLYARFFTMAMHKIGLIDFSEPFLKLRHQGMVLDKQGVKMSKSKGNVVNPDEIVGRFGADATRLCMSFAGPLKENIPWNEDGVVGTFRFLEKVWRMQEKINGDTTDIQEEKEVHRTIKKVSYDVLSLDFNTAVSAMMILVNTLNKKDNISKKSYETLLKLLAPFAPYITEEIWFELGNKDSIHKEKWPTYEEEKIKKDSIVIVVQVNGKVRDKFEINNGTDEEFIKSIALKREKVQSWLNGKTPKKIIFVKNKLVSIVV